MGKTPKHDEHDLKKVEKDKRGPGETPPAEPEPEKVETIEEQGIGPLDPYPTGGE